MSFGGYERGSPPPPRRRGWQGSGVPQQPRCQRSKPIDPPPPTPDQVRGRLPPRHAQGRVEGGELTCMTSRSRRVFRARYSFISRPLQSEGAGNAGRPMRPIAACAMSVIELHALVRSHRNHPAFPTQWFTAYLYRALPGERLFCHRRLARLLARLDTSTAMSGPHDFAVRIRRFRQRRHPRPPHPRPTLMTLRNAPLSGRDAKSYSLICTSEKQKYLCKGDWTV